MTRHRVAALDEIADGERKIVTVGGFEIGIFRVGDTYSAWRNVCPHAGAPVCRGTIEGTMLPSGVYEYVIDESRKIVRCPWHGWEFDLDSGQHLADESVRLKGYPVEVGDDDVYVVIERRVRTATA